VSTLERFRAAVLARDPDAAVAEMAEDVRFYNPGSQEPTIGRQAARATFATLTRVFDEFEHLHVLEERSSASTDVRLHAIHFRARVGDQSLEGVDLLEIEDGEIVSFTVMIRPLAGLAAIAQAAQS
jgi:ketosteroid isomerase-like protein